MLMTNAFADPESCAVMHSSDVVNSCWSAERIAYGIHHSVGQLILTHPE